MKLSGELICAGFIVLISASYWIEYPILKSKAEDQKVSTVTSITVPGIPVRVKYVEILENIDIAFNADPINKEIITSAYLKSLKLYQKNEFKGAVKILNALVSHGHVDSKAILADAYRRGAGVPQSLTHSVLLFTEAANAGSITAAYAVGNLYSSGGEGVAVDLIAAKKYWKIAADANYKPAIKALHSGAEPKLTTTVFFV
jgi:hypothetical protein